MRILGIDYGDKRIGIAISDPLNIIAQALETYERKGKKKDREYFKSIVTKYEISEIVIGMPYQMDGIKGEQALKTEEFGKKLFNILRIPVHYWDERLSTKQAMDILHLQNINHKTGHDKKDKISAGIILSAFLEYRRAKRNET